MAKNSFEYTNRLKKAWRIIDALDHLFATSLGWNAHADGFAIAHHLDTWDASKWASIAVVAGTHPPSAETITLIRDKYRARGEQFQRRTA